LNTAGIFAVGFLVRPLGGWMFGRYADRFGRRAALTLSVTLMGAGSLGIAFLPGYAQIGALAPVLLVIARLLQGLSLGGEYGTSATYLSEVATPHRRGFYSSFQYVTLTSGQLLALGVQIILQQMLTPEQLHSWGWRIAFVIGAAAAVTVMWLRRTMDESPNYELAVRENAAGGERGSLRVLLQYPRECLTVVGLTLGGTIAFYTFTTYMQKFMINTAGLPKEEVTWINFVALLIFVALQPLVGALSDRIGRRPLLIAFGVGATLCTVPLLTAVAHVESALAAFGLMMIGLVIVSGYTSINAVVKAELFPARIRALGVGLPYALTVAIFGGTTEYVALGLKNIGHENWFFGYVAAAALVSLLVYVFMGESSRRSQLERETRELNAGIGESVTVSPTAS
jgi:MHS family alpha-ketoglutarate permease-like MFS transporter